MADLTNSDIIEGTISQSEMGYGKASFKLKEGTSVGWDQGIVITEDYTTESSTSSEDIFDGFIQDYSLTDIKKTTAVSKQDEVARIQPKGRYQGIGSAVLTHMINYYGDFLSAGYGPVNYEYFFNAPWNFASQKPAQDLYNQQIDFISECVPNTSTWHSINASINDGQADVGSVHTNVLTANHSTVSDYFTNDFGVSQGSGTIEFWFMPTNASNGHRWEIRDNNDNPIVRFELDGSNQMYYYNNTTKTLLDAAVWTELFWYRIKIIINGDNTWDLYVYNADLSAYIDVAGAGTYTDNVYAYKFWFSGGILGGNSICYHDAFGYSWEDNYDVGDNTALVSQIFPVMTNMVSHFIDGGQTLQHLLTEIAILEKNIWAIAPYGDIRWHDGTDSSGVVLNADSKVWNVTANAQAKRINRVVLKGAGGLEAIKNDAARQASSGKIIIYTDYRADITDQTKLDTMCQAILDTQKNPPLRVNLSLQWEAKGWIQVGETVEITASTIKYNDSSSYIPAGHYRIISETYHIKDGSYHYIELTLEDGLHYVEQLDSEKIDNNTQNANYSYGGSVSGGSSGLSNLIEDKKVRFCDI